MGRDKILVTIGIPVYNGGKYLREAIDSALAQSHTNLELIISDNASTDETEEICREYESQDSRIQYIRHDKNRGGSLNYDYCVQKAKGLYFTFLAHDDILEKSFLTETIDYLENHKECELVSGDFEFIDESGSHTNNFELDRTREALPWKIRSREFFKYPTSSKIYLLGYGLMRTSIAKKVYANKFVPKMFKGSDMSNFCRIAVEGQIVSIPKILRKFRIHEQSSVKTEVEMLNKKPLLIRRFDLFMNVCEIRFDQIKILIKSSYPLSQKLDILWWLCLKYLENSLVRLKRAPKKIFNLLFSKPTPKKI